jgi:hypothetical protein
MAGVLKLMIVPGGRWCPLGSVRGVEETTRSRLLAALEWSRYDSRMTDSRKGILRARSRAAGPSPSVVFL